MRGNVIMKQGKRLIAIILVLVTVLAVLPASAFASNKYKTLKFNKWYNLNRSQSNMIIYKLKVSEDSLITIEWKGNNYNNPIYGIIYKDRNCNIEIDSFLDNYSKSKGSSKIVLYSGTYYIAMFEDSYSWKTTQIRATKQSIKSIINEKNTTYKKAVTLKPNKIIELFFTKNNNKQRWYKIKLTKTQKISLYTYSSGLSYHIFDNSLKDITPNGGSVTVYPGREFLKLIPHIKLAKGTYYLMFDTDEDDIEEMKDRGIYYKLYWQ